MPLLPFKNAMYRVAFVSSSDANTLWAPPAFAVPPAHEPDPIAIGTSPDDPELPVDSWIVAGLILSTISKFVLGLYVNWSSCLKFFDPEALPSTNER